ncbi:hypothetical protein [Hydrogenophaga sp.]|uniref:hypothetical protein n=1 Tax=Hydrogenophaga sp. TaxID=1904254 RepID=UPI0035AE33E0
MNCKPGDLAIVVRSENGNAGKVVTCIRLATKTDLENEGLFCPDDVWVVDRHLLVTNAFGKNGKHVRLCPDSVLRPIRPQADGATDETLTWLPVPSREKEAA